ncbi:MAG TPA: DUF3341 domain-containing protein [Rhodopila sp.]|nr:DUF3341 domain-containing protein [Rhodopila sp.]
MREDEAKFYGVSAEFATPEALLAAVQDLRQRGMGLLDTFSPLPIPGMGTALGVRGPTLGYIALAAVLLGGFGCFGMIVYATIWGYDFMIAGRPVFSWPYYIVPSFASAMALGAIAVFVGMLFLDRLPRLNHPVFNIDGIEGVTQDRLFLLVEARSDDFDTEAVEEVLAHLPIRPLRIQRVPR